MAAERLFIDLFSGCGGLSLGLSQAGWRGLFAIERDAMAFKTFGANFLSESSQHTFAWPDWLEQKAMTIEMLLKEHNAQLPQLWRRVDLVAGGPPCQGFSFAGKRQQRDPRNLMFKRYATFVRAVEPAAIVLENVPGMQIPHGQIARARSARPKRATKSYYDRLREELAGDYDIDAHVIDAARFGVPQRRARLIVLGLRSDVAAKVPGGAAGLFELLEAARREQLRLLKLPEANSARSAISDLEVVRRQLKDCADPDSPKGYKEIVYAGPRTHYQRLMHDGLTPLEIDNIRLAKHRDDVRERFRAILAQCRPGVRMNDADRKRFGLLKHRIYPMARDQPAPTLTTLPDDVLHYSEPRILTVREYARLQSFPDSFQFRGKYTTGGKERKKECPRYTQVGNAVPPLLARAIGNAILACLDQSQDRAAPPATCHAREKRISAGTLEPASILAET